jgi:polyvinyl alcohol dehydrogenase (cytochrome)
MVLVLAKLSLTILLLAPALAAQGVSGEAVYRSRCASCHDGASPRVPPRAALQQLTSARILRVLDFGTMLSVGNLLNREEREAVAAYLGTEGPPVAETPEAAFCRDRAVNLTGPAWNGWSPEGTNTRFQPAGSAGLTLAGVPKLKLKWAFGYDGDTIAFSQPTVIGGTIVAGSASGKVHALDRESGCVKWVFQADGPVRAAPVFASAAGGGIVLFGDQIGWFYALDAGTGSLRWRKKVEEHESARITAAAMVHDGIAYVPVASAEETRALNAGYRCCTFRGSVAALRIADGTQVWKTYMVSDAPALRGKNGESAEQWGPSGAGIWSTPTLDQKRGLLYVATGDNYSEPATPLSDAVVALTLADGEIAWSRQTTPNDVFNGYCYVRNECPGPDFDYGAPAILVTLEGGRDLLLAGQKSGVVYALDPDDGGAILWQARVGQGGPNGGVQWGMAADGQKVYAANSDVVRPRASNPDPNDPRPVPFDPKVGGGLAALRLASGDRIWYAEPPVCPDTRPGCSPAQSSAVTAIPGVVFSAALDGHLRAYSSEDGSVLWDFDTVRAFETVNGVRASGGAIDGPGPVISNGMLLVNSGYARAGGMAGNVLLAFEAEP